MDPQELEVVEKELLDLIIAHLKENKIKVVEAQQLARDFLDSLPITDQKDLLIKLKSLGDTYPEAGQVYVDELSKSEVKNRDQKLTEIRNHIKLGNIDQAIASAKSITQN